MADITIELILRVIPFCNHVEENCHAIYGLRWQTYPIVKAILCLRQELSPYQWVGWLRSISMAVLYNAGFWL